MGIAADDSLYNVRKTKALPKHSLFGTSFEMFTEEEKQRINSIDLNTNACVNQKIPIADHLLQNIKGREEAAEKRREFEKRKKITEQTRQNMKTFEQDAILVCTGSQSKDMSHVIKAATRREEPARCGTWFTGKDIEHSREINFSTMPDNYRSYNRDKFSRLPPIYKNPAVDVFSRPRRQSVVSAEPRGPYQQGRPDLSGDVRRMASPCVHEPAADEPAADDPSVSNYICVPQNIRHRFGSKVCDSLLSDEKKVQDTLARLHTAPCYLPQKGSPRVHSASQQSQRSSQRTPTHSQHIERTSPHAQRTIRQTKSDVQLQTKSDHQQAQRTSQTARRDDERTPRFSQQTKRENQQQTPVRISDYDALSIITRQNVIPGLSIRNPQSTSKSTYNEAVLLRRVPETDEFKYKKHSLSRWVEDNVRRERTRKDWDEKFSTNTK
ncbi:uncharacterized protein LOC121379147 isoform X2 [Gigantopelta aegis]|uniref:uncharacterized protein LOC121379147 isoform X2 n=1 Tax=Gigantopelta aegis TaxID=1735272 RepID=UPI001B88C547|nr:uncharacterized protein LOC121379147 isoform X2 [Gigantopelta aegis]XP_041363569.1 uncharacterized protein LOC121379147 isoform X2 [Gigantopelta aegis]